MLLVYNNDSSGARRLAYASENVGQIKLRVHTERNKKDKANPIKKEPCECEGRRECPKEGIAR